MPNACGSCTVCCYEMGVEELNKPFCAECPSLGTGGCSRYATRPESCVEFECMWLTDSKNPVRLLTDVDRPDLSGVLLHAGPEMPTGPTLVARGDFDRGAYLLQRLSQFALVVMMRDGKPFRLQGPDEAVREFMSATIMVDDQVVHLRKRGSGDDDRSGDVVAD